jgi:hypothetical protein
LFLLQLPLLHRKHSAPHTPPSRSDSQTQTQDDPGRLALKAVTLSGESTSFILGVVFLGLVLLTALTFFVRLEIQSHEILMGSVVVAGVALLFLVFNNSDVLHRAVQNQAAAGTGMYSGLVDGGAYQIEVFGG